MVVGSVLHWLQDGSTSMLFRCTRCFLLIIILLLLYLVKILTLTILVDIVGEVVTFMVIVPSFVIIIIDIRIITFLFSIHETAFTSLPQLILG